MPARVLTIGEILHVLRAPGGTTLERSRLLESLVGGAEANVAIGLTRLGIPVAWMSRVEDDPIGRSLVGIIRGQGVDTDPVIWTHGHRTGIMYAELGIFPRKNRVVYDRNATPATKMSPDDIASSLFDGIELVHLTGITPAISDSCRATVLKAAEMARSVRCVVSFDINYRSKLWPGLEAAAFLHEIRSFVDILFIGKDEAKTVFGYTGSPQAVLELLQATLGIPRIVLTLGEEGASALWDSRLVRVPAFEIERTNRFGGGDAFVAGFLPVFRTKAIIT